MKVQLNTLVKSILLVVLMLVVSRANAVDDTIYISSKKLKGSFPLSSKGKSAVLLSDPNDFPGVIRAVKNLQSDIKAVSKAEPRHLSSLQRDKEVVLVGTIGKSALIDQLIQQKKLDVNGVSGKWETFVIQVVENPFEGVDRALVIAGSDKRGTIFGIYDLSAQIGVSPWHYWADVPAKDRKEIHVLPGRHTKGEPAVKYRGIFINDEAPALSGWSKKEFGGFNHKFYEKVFELILRLKGNYLWPAMWGSAFYDDDPENPKLADEMGVVIGTSHHEPLMRAHDEWRRFGKGAWNYNTNEKALQEFWRTGIRRMGKNESIVTIGMRGDGDEPMSESSNIALLEKIVKDQREIIADVTGKPASETPQIWALYKEVQDYYDKGMRVPDDVTLLLCDDNWGNIRKLPKPGEKPRAGGYGIYYHYDYVGGPRNYKWLNTNPIAKVWEQMHLAREYGADKLWLVNVGDIKPMEFPTEFFLDYAWNPEKWPETRLQEYTELWAKREFGEKYAKEIAAIISEYTKYNGRRKPELLSPETYSLTDYREFERVVDDYNALLAKAEKINVELAPELRDAYFQLVLHPVKACANLNDLYFTVAKNRWYAAQGRASTNALAEKARQLFKKDADISRQYNKEISGGKWNHMMDQTHIGYTYWQQPEKDVMPDVKEIAVAGGAEMGVSVEGSLLWWPDEKSQAVLPEFNPVGNQSHYIEIFNRGKQPFSYEIKTGAYWLQAASSKGTVDKDQRIWFSVDWKKAPAGLQKVPITIMANNSTVTVMAVIRNIPSNQTADFVEVDGYVSIEAAHFSRSSGKDSITWKVLPDHGRTLSAVTSFPVTAPASKPGSGPVLEYDIDIQQAGEVTIHTYVSPSIDFTGTDGLEFAISFDDDDVRVVNLHADDSQTAWEKSVAENIHTLRTKYQLKTAGKRTLKLWRVDAGVVFQKIVIDTGGLKPSYLGPPDTRVKTVKK